MFQVWIEIIKLVEQIQMMVYSLLPTVNCVQEEESGGHRDPWSGHHLWTFHIHSQTSGRHLLQTPQPDQGVHCHPAHEPLQGKQSIGLTLVRWVICLFEHQPGVFLLTHRQTATWGITFTLLKINLRTPSSMTAMVLSCPCLPSSMVGTVSVFFISGSVLCLCCIRYIPYQYRLSYQLANGNCFRLFKQAFFGGNIQRSWAEDSQAQVEINLMYPLSVC